MNHICVSPIKPTRARVVAFRREPTITNPESQIWCVEYQNNMLLQDIRYCPWCGTSLRIEAQHSMSRTLQDPHPHPRVHVINTDALGMICLERLTPHTVKEVIPVVVSTESVVPDGTLTAQTIREYQEVIIE